MDKIFKNKADILQELVRCLTVQTSDPWQKDVYRRLLLYTERGKLIRGCLTLYVKEMFAPDLLADGLPLAVALELVHAAFLIHDDIMDQDELRRGMPSIHNQYQKLLRDEGREGWQHNGESLAICAGDAAIFLAYFQIERLSVDRDIKKHLTRLLFEEWLRVCFGQMQDIWLSGSKNARKEEVLQMYKDKTARYTFSLPLVFGGILGSQPDQVLQTLDKLGEKIGLLFQLRDDELNYRGNPEIIGKPRGSDLKNNKSTYLRSVNFDEKQVTELMYKLETEATELIEKIPIKTSDKHTLVNLVEFVKKREK